MRTVAKPVLNVPFFLKKITPKFVTDAVGEISLLELPRPVEPRHLYDLFGTIRFATIVADKSGTKKDSVRFSGKLKAYTPPNENGEQYIFESGQTFIPVFDEYMYTALKDAQAVEPGAYLEVALSISIKPAEPGKPSMTGYEWEVQKLIAQQPAKDDPIERLRAEAKSQQLALTAPKPGPTAAVAPAGEAGLASATPASSNGSPATENSSAPVEQPHTHRKGARHAA
jgi:hypothetical protein